MHFNLSEERQMLKDTVERFLSDNYGKIKNHHEYSTLNEGYNVKIWNESSDIGMIGGLIPPKYNGLGGSGEDIMIIFELIGKYLCVEPFLSTGLMSSTALISCGSNSNELLEEIISGKKIISFCHSEIESRYDETLVKVKATKNNNLWYIDGKKSFVLNGDQANIFIVSARIKGNTSDKNGIGIFKVEAKNCNIRSYNTIDGYRCSEVTFNNVPGKLLCSDEKAYECILETIYAGALAVSSEAIGIMQKCFDLTIDYLKTRTQFGKTIGSFQALQHRMVDLMIEIEQAKSSVMLAAGTYNFEKLIKYKNISAAKNLVGRVGKLVAEECIQLHGGIGMTWEYNLHNFAKRLVMIDHLMGDSDHHLEKFKIYCSY